jgi:putative ABC transport system substrate-binding protein
MRRRGFIALIWCAAALLPLLALAQTPAKRYRVGFLGNSTATLEANLVGPFRDGLRALGYDEDRNITIEYRWANGEYERLPTLVAELIALKVDVIVTAGTPAALAVKKATSTIPLVMVAVGDPVGTGLVGSLARPGANITGLTSISPELEGKRLELLREVIPALSKVAVLWNPISPFQVLSEKEVQAAGQMFRVQVLSLGVRSHEEIEAAFTTLSGEQPDGLLVLADRLFLHNRLLIADFAVQKRLPGVYAYRELVEAGGLMAYGPSYPEMHRRAATYVGKILKGAMPADLPIERPVKFEFVVNLKAAKALGLTIPPTLLARADEVIE